MLFTLAAGIVNATALMACDSFVTNLTGSVTSLGLRSVATRALLVIVASFIAGAMLAFLAIETLRARTSAAFALPVLAVFAILVGIAVAGKAGAFGVFGEPLGGRETFLMLSLLALGSGLLNAAVANATANRVRVTHMTGPATDLAGNLVRAALDAGEGSRVESRWAMLRVAKLVAFVAGAAIAAQLSDRLGYDTFVVAAAIVILALGAVGPPAAVAAGERT